jgi:hypothetical protein
MTKFIMFFHEALQSYLLAVQQITPLFAYMVSIICFVCVYEKLLEPNPIIWRLNNLCCSVTKICVVSLRVMSLCSYQRWSQYMI